MDKNSESNGVNPSIPTSSSVKHMTMEEIREALSRLPEFDRALNPIVFTAVDSEYFLKEPITLPQCGKVSVSHILDAVRKQTPQEIIMYHCLRYIMDYRCDKTTKSYLEERHIPPTLDSTAVEAIESDAPQFRIKGLKLNDPESTDQIGVAICFALIGFGCRGEESKKNKSTKLMKDILNMFGIPRAVVRGVPDIPTTWTKPSDAILKAAACVAAFFGSLRFYNKLIPSITHGFITPACQGHMVLHSRLEKLNEIAPFLIRDDRFSGITHIQKALEAMKKFEDEVQLTQNRTAVTVSRLVSHRYLTYFTGRKIKKATAILLFAITLVEGKKSFAAFLRFTSKEYNRGAVLQLGGDLKMVTRIVKDAMRTNGAAWDLGSLGSAL